MYNVDDLILNIDEAYEKCDERLKKNYRREFSQYGVSTLEKIWTAIEENHQMSKAPEMGHIFKYMNIKGIGRQKDSGIFWNKCDSCGCNYSLRARTCPDCNRDSKDIVFNSVTVIKGEKYSPTHVTCRENCSICPVFKNNRLARGVKCKYWNTEDRIHGNCDGCPCKPCCNEEPSKDHEWEIGTLIKHVKKD